MRARTHFGSRSIPTQRRGAAVFMVIGIIGLTTASSLLAINQVQSNLNIVDSSVQQAASHQVATACSAGALKVLPGLLDSMIQLMEQGVAYSDSLFASQFDVAFFGESPLGGDERAPFCVSRIIDIQDDIPMVGYSRRGGCFKRVTLEVEGIVSRESADTATEVQRQTETSRTIVLHGTFGPLACN
jgi:hypothetical protein